MVHISQKITCCHWNRSKSGKKIDYWSQQSYNSSQIIATMAWQNFSKIIPPMSSESCYQVSKKPMSARKWFSYRQDNCSCVSKNLSQRQHKQIWLYSAGWFLQKIKSAGPFIWWSNKFRFITHLLITIANVTIVNVNIVEESQEACWIFGMP